MVMESISREFRVALPRELLYADDLVVIDADDLAVIGDHPSLILVWYPWLCSQLVQILSVISLLSCKM